MKQAYLFILLCLASVAVSQTTIHITNTDANGAVINDNAIMYYSTSSYTTLEHHMLVKNSGTAAADFTVRRYDDLLNKVSSTDSAIAYFCTGITCYDQTVFTSTFNLAAGDTLSFKSYLAEASTVGLSNVRYKFTNGASNESMTFTLKYNNINSVEEGSFVSFGMFPNPCVNGFYVSAGFSGRATLMNLLGQPVRTAEINAGDSYVSTEGLAAGVYQVSVQGSTASASKKIFITK
jgi:hypothetical protein